MANNKFPYFKFYLLYKGAFEELSGKNSKKLILALCEYAQDGFVTIKLNSKTQKYFNSIKSFYDADKLKYVEYGRKGGLKSKGVHKKYRG